MNYPKPIMTIGELTEMGFSEKMLRKVFTSKGYPYAFKETGTRTCPIKFNTELLDKYLSQINERRR